MKLFLLFTSSVRILTRSFLPSHCTAYEHLVKNTPSSIFEGMNITLGVASQTSLSFLLLYYDATNDLVYPFLTAVISVKDGTITGITWDDACIFCGGFADACKEDTYDFNGNQVYQSTAGQQTKGCYLKASECVTVEGGKGFPAGSNSCDLTVYVVWSGTDSGGKALQSQAYRFSEFPVQELTDALTSSIPTFGLT